MTPMFIQEPFWQLTYQLPFASYISINPQHAISPAALGEKGRALHEGIERVFEDAILLKKREERKEENEDHRILEATGSDIRKGEEDEQ